MDCSMLSYQVKARNEIENHLHIEILMEIAIVQNQVARQKMKISRIKIF